MPASRDADGSGPLPSAASTSYAGTEDQSALHTPHRAIAAAAAAAAIAAAVLSFGSPAMAFSQTALADPTSAPGVSDTQPAVLSEPKAPTRYRFPARLAAPPPSSAKPATVMEDVEAVVQAAGEAAHEAAQTAEYAIKGLIPSEVSEALQPVTDEAELVWGSYNSLLDRYPLPTKMVTGGVGTLLGDLLAQYSSFWLVNRTAQRKFTRRKALYAQKEADRAATKQAADKLEAAWKLDAAAGLSADITSATVAAVPLGGSNPEATFQYNWRRAGRYALFYTVIATPIDVTFYDWLDTVVLPNDPNSLAAAVGKMTADELFSTPLVTIGLFATMKTLEGQPAQAVPFIKKNLWPTLMANYKVWPLAQVVNFLVVPASQRILYIQVVSIFWVAFLSYIINVKDEPSALDSIDEYIEVEDVGAAVAAVERAGTATRARLALATRRTRREGTVSTRPGTVLTRRDGTVSTRRDGTVSTRPGSQSTRPQQSFAMRSVDAASTTLSAAVAGASAMATAVASMNMDMLVQADVSGPEVATVSVLAMAAFADAANRYARLSQDGNDSDDNEDIHDDIRDLDDDLGGDDDSSDDWDYEDEEALPGASALGVQGPGEDGVEAGTSVEAGKGVEAGAAGVPDQGAAGSSVQSVSLGSRG